MIIKSVKGRMVVYEDDGITLDAKFYQLKLKLEWELARDKK